MKKNLVSVQAILILALNAALAVILVSGLPANFNRAVFLDRDPTIHEAMFYDRVDHGIKCGLCPRKCYLPEGMRGKCRVRVDTNGTLYTMVYGKPASVNVDPIEKKPVFHLKPGSKAFSIATNGCNLRCNFCQNWELSQCRAETKGTGLLMPQQVVEMAQRYNCASIAYTYSEPTVFYEYVYDTARLAKEKGIYNVFISAGYIEKAPLEKLLPYLDVIKIDLKGFDDGFYRRIVDCGLDDILSTLKVLKANNKLFEVVNLVVPGLNDDMDGIRAMSKWISVNLGKDTPLFFSRFTPRYLLSNLPETPAETLMKAHSIAKEEGLSYVYLGNVPGSIYENTYCPNCGKIVVARYGYTVTGAHIDGGKCAYCGYPIRGIW